MLLRPGHAQGALDSSIPNEASLFDTADFDGPRLVESDKAELNASIDRMQVRVQDVVVPPWVLANWRGCLGWLFGG